ncbi:MAG: GAF domain-containing protein, partial [Pseudolabrys sp.]
MRRPDKAGGKAVKPRRHMTLKRRNAAKVGRKPPTIDAAERIAQLEHRLNEALEQQSATSEVLRVIASSPTEIQPVLDAIVTTAGRLLDVADAYIMRVEGQLLRAVARHGSSPQFARWGIGATRPINRGWVTGRAVVDRKTVHVRDLQAAQSEFPEGAAYAKQYGHRTTLATPLLREGNPIGAFLIRRNYVEPFTNKQIELLQNFAAHAVIAIENVRLLSELRESLQHQTATSEILASISGAMTDTKPVFDAIVRNLLRLFGTCFATVQLLHDGIVEMPAAGGEAGIEKIMGLYPRPLDDTTAGGQAMLSRQVVQFSPVVGNPLAPQGAQQIASKFDYNSIIAAPMIRQDKVIGAIICAHRGQRVFNEKEVALIKAFADQAVIAIENVRLFDEVQGRTRELAASLDDLRTTQDRLVQTQKLALLGQLTAGIAHEIKNPLNFVNNFAALSAELTDELNDALKPVPLAGTIREEVD